MMGEENIKEQMISSEQYGDDITDCALSAVNTAIGPFFLGAIGIPTSLKYLDKIFVTSYEVKACASVLGAVGLAIYTAKKVRINCEKRVQENYKL